MQHGCKEIYRARLQSTKQGKEAYEEAEADESPYVGEVFGPPSRNLQG